MLNRLRILLLEDNLDGQEPKITDSTRVWIGSMLGQNVVLENVTKSAQAVAQLNKSDYDVALLDINLGSKSPFGEIKFCVAAWPSLYRNSGTIPIILPIQTSRKLTKHSRRTVVLFVSS